MDTFSARLGSALAAVDRAKNYCMEKMGVIRGEACIHREKRPKIIGESIEKGMHSRMYLH